MDEDDEGGQQGLDAVPGALRGAQGVPEEEGAQGEAGDEDDELGPGAAEQLKATEDEARRGGVRGRCGAQDAQGMGRSVGDEACC